MQSSHNRSSYWKLKLYPIFILQENFFVEDTDFEQLWTIHYDSAGFTILRCEFILKETLIFINTPRILHVT